MKLVVNPPPVLSVFGNDLDVVIAVGETDIPGIYLAEDRPRPDRHLLLAMIQVISMAVQENDLETFERMDSASVELQGAQSVGNLTSKLIVVRARDGSFGALGVGELKSLRALARKAVRYFTGTIRLDIP